MEQLEVTLPLPLGLGFTAQNVVSDSAESLAAKSKRKGKRDRERTQARASRVAVSTYTTLQRAGVLLEEKLGAQAVWRAWTANEQPLGALHESCAVGTWSRACAASLRHTHAWHPCTSAAAQAASPQSVPMCLYPPKDDIISDQIRKMGSWHDCDGLVQMWQWNTTALHRGRQLLLELGGNIGACTVEMLMRTSASLLVFEPNPQNLFHLTSTLRTIELERPQLGVADRVVVFPIGIGNASFESQLHVARRNHGDSIVGTAVPRQGQLRVSHVRTQQTAIIRPLDAIFPRSSRLGLGFFRLMKMDVQVRHPLRRHLRRR